MCEDFKYMAKASNGMGMGTEFLCRAEYLLETGSYDRVMEFATKAIFVASAYQQTCIVVCAKMTIARMLNCQGKIQDAADILREIETLRTTQTDPADIDVIDNCLGYLHVLLNKPGVPEWMTDVDMLMERRKNQGLAFSLTVYGMYLIRETEYLKFDALFEIIHAKQIALKNQMGLIYNYIHKAIASKHLYGAPEGVEALQKAVDIADQDEIAMPFIENIEELKTIFACESLVARADFICKIMNHKEQFVKNRSTRILSLREIEVLSLVEKGYSGEQIGETLFISPWTAKRHIQNIYSKLGVNSRIAAINKFREQI
ncbi:MAG: LuxR C-terminal-related transcriptional regulator [Clostridiales Family XIII bacterium]|nr:LuxR C-terminal-related transcriptional regulator [Clostridiales Family XIII bacterium]